ncbi:MAG: HlyD family efflux transporter periplasmic adaptor subunit [Pseudomonadota bacterium]|nr:HlyD family efflux transporter periplasmic adaptor subunit [Pseudomonadota bacterium]
MELGPDLLDVVDWSPEGLRVAVWPAALPQDEVVTVVVAAAVEGMWMSFQADVRVVRRAPLGPEVGLAFVSLPASGRELLEYLSQAAIDGETVSAVGLLGRVDPTLLTAGQPTGGPVTALTTAAAPAPSPPPVEPPRPTPATSSASPVGRRVRTVLYLVAGVLLTAYIADSLYRRVWRIEVDTASLVAPTARIVSPADGVIQALEVAPGDHVGAGAELFRVESPSIQAEVDRATLEAAQADVRVAELEAERDAQEERLSIHGRIVRNRIESGRAQVSLLENRLAMAAAQVARLEALVGNGISPVEVDAERARWAALAGTVEQARTSLATDERRLIAARGGYYFDGTGIEEGLPEVEAALVAAISERDLEKSQLATRQAHAAAAQIGRAPFAGRLAQVLQTQGTPVRQGNLVVVLERDDERRVEAWVTRQQAEYVRLGDTARVTVAGLGRTYDATVRSILSDAFASGQMAAAGKDPRLQVILELGGYAGAPDSREAAVRELRDASAVGLPAVVSFARSWR